MNLNIIKFFDKLKLNTRINLFIISLVIIIFTALGFTIYLREKSRVLEATDDRMFVQLNDLSNIIDVQIQRTNKEVIAKKIKYFVYTDFNIDSNRSVNADKVNQFIDNIQLKNSEIDFSAIKQIFSNKKIYETGYAFIINKAGIVKVHPTLEGKNLSDTYFYQEMVSFKNGKVNYIWPETENGKNKILYYQYYEPLDSYICISIYESEVLKQISGLSYFIIVGLIISILIFIIGTTYIVRSITRIIKKLLENINYMSKGKLVDRIDTNRSDELGDIIGSINVLIDGLKSTSKFSNEIGKGNLNAEYKPLSDEDELGNSLIEMRNNLHKAKEEEQRRKAEDEKRNWATQGLAKFAEILRQNNDNLEILSFNIISNLVNYLNANQGGIFVVNNDEKSDIHIELTSAVAFSKQKFMKKRLEIEEGLVGRSIKEKKTIYLTEIPNDYLDITSGLGKTNPKFLLLVPLKLNDVVYGVFEIASFTEFEPYHIDFVEKIGESVASTISTVKINVQTAYLLHQSQIQAEQMRSQEEEMRQNMEELQATQEEAARQQEKQQSLANSVNQSIIHAEYDLDGMLIFANEKFIKNFEYYSFSELDGRHVSLFIDKKYYKNYDEIWDNIIRTGKPFEGEIKHITKAGSELWTYATYNCIRDKDGRIDKILFLAFNVNEQKHKTLELESQIEILDLSAIKAEFNIEGKIVNANNIFLKTISVETLTEAREKTIFNFISNEDNHSFRNLWSDIVVGKHYEGSLRLFDTKGQYRWFNINLSPVKDINSVIYKIILVATDITDLRKMEILLQEKSKLLNDKEIEVNYNLEEVIKTREELTKHTIEIENLKKELELKNSNLIECENKLADYKANYKQNEEKYIMEIAELKKQIDKK